MIKRSYNRRNWKRDTEANKNKLSKYNTRQLIKPMYNGRLQQPVHYFTRYHGLGLITGSNGASATYGQIHFKLSDVPGYGEFSNMYDFFKISAVQVSFIPVSNVSLGNSVPLGQQTGFTNRIFTCFDYNDKTAPTSTNQVREYANCKWSPNNVIHKRFIYPKPIVTVDEDGPGVGNYGAASFGKNPWISMANDSCEYYGIKFAIHHVSLSQSTDLYEVEAKFYLAFKARK